MRAVLKTFGDVVAVDHLDLDVHPGEFISLLGPSGCGKTTTLRMLAGFEHPDEGNISISGRSVLGVPPYRRDVNTVFQAYALFPHMSVAENVAYGLRQRKVSKSEMRSRVMDALDMVKMTALANRKPSQLSGGQQQRVALARALVNRPSLLLLDEPLAALDRKLREEMQVELKLLQSQLGTTFVFVTHDQGEAMSMSDRIAVMLDGRIEQLGDPYTIYEEPSSAFVAGFIGQQNFFPGLADDSGRRVVCASSVLRTSRAAAPLPNGSQALAAVRPGTIRLAETEPPQLENRLTGRLAGVSHLGDVIQYVVVTPDGRDVLSRVPRAIAPRVEVGSDVWCSWDDDHVHVFPATSTNGGPPHD
jgi:spermidine/putrescine transport system ATP-binding protein